MAQMGTLSEGCREMSPALIRQLLDLYTLPDPEILESCVEALIDDELIRHGSHGYECTERGKHMMEMLMDVPLPIQIWTDPRTAK